MASDASVRRLFAIQRLLDGKGTYNIEALTRFIGLMGDDERGKISSVVQENIDSTTGDEKRMWELIQGRFRDVSRASDPDVNVVTQARGIGRTIEQDAAAAHARRALGLTQFEGVKTDWYLSGYEREFLDTHQTPQAEAAVRTILSESQSARAKELADAVRQARWNLKNAKRTGAELPEFLREGDTVVTAEGAISRAQRTLDRAIDARRSFAYHVFNDAVRSLPKEERIELSPRTIEAAKERVRKASAARLKMQYEVQPWARNMINARLRNIGEMDVEAIAQFIEHATDSQGEREIADDFAERVGLFRSYVSSTIDPLIEAVEKLSERDSIRSKKLLEGTRAKLAESVDEAFHLLDENELSLGGLLNAALVSPEDVGGADIDALLFDIYKLEQHQGAHSEFRLPHRELIETALQIIHDSRTTTDTQGHADDVAAMHRFEQDVAEELYTRLGSETISTKSVVSLKQAVSAGIVPRQDIISIYARLKLDLGSLDIDPDVLRDIVEGLGYLGQETNDPNLFIDLHRKPVRRGQTMAAAKAEIAKQLRIARFAIDQDIVDRSSFDDDGRLIAPADRAIDGDFRIVRSLKEGRTPQVLEGMPFRATGDGRILVPYSRATEVVLRNPRDMMRSLAAVTNVDTMMASRKNQTAMVMRDAIGFIANEINESTDLMMDATRSASGYTITQKGRTLIAIPAEKERQLRNLLTHADEYDRATFREEVLRLAGYDIRGIIPNRDGVFAGIEDMRTLIHEQRVEAVASHWGLDLADAGRREQIDTILSKSNGIFADTAKAIHGTQGEATSTQLERSIVRSIENPANKAQLQRLTGYFHTARVKMVQGGSNTGSYMTMYAPGGIVSDSFRGAVASHRARGIVEMVPDSGLVYGDVFLGMADRVKETSTKDQIYDAAAEALHDTIVRHKKLSDDDSVLLKKYIELIRDRSAGVDFDADELAELEKLVVDDETVSVISWTMNNLRNTSTDKTPFLAESLVRVSKQAHEMQRERGKVQRIARGALEDVDPDTAESVVARMFTTSGLVDADGHFTDTKGFLRATRGKGKRAVAYIPVEDVLTSGRIDGRVGDPKTFRRLFALMTGAEYRDDVVVASNAVRRVRALSGSHLRGQQADRMIGIFRALSNDSDNRIAALIEDVGDGVGDYETYTPEQKKYLVSALEAIQENIRDNMAASTREGGRPNGDILELVVTSDAKQRKYLKSNHDEIVGDHMPTVAKDMMHEARMTVRDAIQTLFADQYSSVDGRTTYDAMLELKDFFGSADQGSMSLFRPIGTDESGDILQLIDQLESAGDDIDDIIHGGMPAEAMQGYFERQYLDSRLLAYLQGQLKHKMPSFRAQAESDARALLDRMGVVVGTDVRAAVDGRLRTIKESTNRVIAASSNLGEQEKRAFDEALRSGRHRAGKQTAELATRMGAASHAELLDVAEKTSPEAVEAQLQAVREFLKKTKINANVKDLATARNALKQLTMGLDQSGVLSSGYAGIIADIGRTQHSSILDALDDADLEDLILGEKNTRLLLDSLSQGDMIVDTTGNGLISGMADTTLQVARAAQEDARYLPVLDTMIRPTQAYDPSGTLVEIPANARLTGVMTRSDGVFMTYTGSEGSVMANLGIRYSDTPGHEGAQIGFSEVGPGAWLDWADSVRGQDLRGRFITRFDTGRISGMQAEESMAAINEIIKREGFREQDILDIAHTLMPDLPDDITAQEFMLSAAQSNKTRQLGRPFGSIVTAAGETQPARGGVKGAERSALDMLLELMRTYTDEANGTLDADFEKSPEYEALQTLARNGEDITERMEQARAQHKMWRMQVAHEAFVDLAGRTDLGGQSDEPLLTAKFVTTYTNYLRRKTAPEGAPVHFAVGELDDLGDFGNAVKGAMNYAIDPTIDAAREFFTHKQAGWIAGAGIIATMALAARAAFKKPDRDTTVDVDMPNEQASTRISMRDSGYDGTVGADRYSPSPITPGATGAYRGSSSGSVINVRDNMNTLSAADLDDIMSGG